MKSDIKTAHLTATAIVFAGPGRIKAVSWVGGGTAGSITFRDGGAGGTTVWILDAPAGVGTLGYIELPENGIRCETDVHATLSVLALVTVYYA